MALAARQRLLALWGAPCAYHGAPARSLSTRRLSLDEVTAFAKRAGFVFPSSGGYGSAGTGHDYGPAGWALKRSLMDAWWSSFVTSRPDCVGVDTGLLLNPRVWEASGHVKNFSDPVSDCSSCGSRVRADKLVPGGGALGLPALEAALTGCACPVCSAKGSLGPPRPFNMLFSTGVGVTAGTAAAATPASSNPNATSHAYLRPETAQGAYVLLPSVLGSTRRRLPLGLGQAGKSFRNEIGVANFVFRTREFEQMELQFFCDPEDSPRWHAYWVSFSERWLKDVVGLAPESLRRRVYGAGELAHYALATTDLEYEWPWGWDELCGISNRGDYDSAAHAAGSGADMKYRDPVSGRVRVGDRCRRCHPATSNLSHPPPSLPFQTFLPHAVEPALGLNRLFLALLCNKLGEEVVPTAVAASSSSTDPPARTRLVFRVPEALAPVKLSLLPVVKSSPLLALSSDLRDALLPHLPVEVDSTQSIGRRYRRADEMGTPLCLTLDSESLSHGTATLRCRDTMVQIRLSLEEVKQRAAARTLTRAALDPLFRQVVDVQA